MSNEHADVGEFHQQFGLPWTDEQASATEGTEVGPRDVPDDLMRFRAEFVNEELDELWAGVEANDLGQVADALVDLVYVALGTAHLLGLPWAELWHDVQRANMAKTRALPDGSDSKRGSAWDVVKPPGWIPPQTWAILESHGWTPPEPAPVGTFIEIDQDDVV